jgi:hypothetical protein
LEWYEKANNLITIFYDLLVGCQIILIFYFIFQKVIFKYLIFLFILSEVIVLYTLGFSVAAATVIIGVGCFISLILNIGAIIQYILKSEPSNTEHALAFLYAGFIFYFTQFMIIFEYNYLHFDMSALPYLKAIDFLSSSIAISIISFGMMKYPVSHRK